MTERHLTNDLGICRHTITLLVSITDMLSVQVFFPAVDKAWKTKILSIVSQNGPQVGLMTRFDSLPVDQVVHI